MDIVRVYLKSLIGNNKLPIVIKLPLGIKDFWLVKVGFLIRLLRSIYDLKQSG